MFSRMFFILFCAGLLAACGSGAITTTDAPMVTTATSGSHPTIQRSLTPEATRTAAPSHTPAPTNTIIPSPTLSPTPRPTKTTTPTITPTPTPLPEHVVLAPINHQWQSLNNCHRASIAALMGFYDVWFDQHEYDLGMDNLDEFVSPYSLRARIYQVQYATEPAHQMARWFLGQGIPLIVGQDLSIGDNTWHYRVAYGYDDGRQEIYLSDSLLGPQLVLSYDTFDRLSQRVGQLIPVYPAEYDDSIQSQMRRWYMQEVVYP